jgi:hypothetical protein
MKILLSLSKSAEVIEKLLPLGVLDRMKYTIQMFPTDSIAFLINASSLNAHIGRAMDLTFVDSLMASKNEGLVWKLLGNLCKSDQRILTHIMNHLPCDESLLPFFAKDGFENVFCDLTGSLVWVEKIKNLFSPLLELLLLSHYDEKPNVACLGSLKNLLFHDDMLNLAMTKPEYHEALIKWILDEDDRGAFFEDECRQILILEIYLLLCRYETGRKALRATTLVSFLPQSIVIH